MNKFKFFRGYSGNINTMNGVTYATGAISNQINPYWAMEEVNRARIMNQSEEDRVRRERFRIQAEIQSRLRQYGETLNDIEAQALRTREIEERIDNIKIINPMCPYDLDYFNYYY